MDTRDAVLARLRQRLDQAQQDRSPSGLLNDTALAEAAALAAASGAGPDDAQSLHVLGWFHWYRFQGLPEPLNHGDFRAAVRFLEPIYQVAPAAVPEQLRRLFAGDTPAVAIETVRRASHLLWQYQVTGDLSLLQECVASFRSAFQTAPTDFADRAVYLSEFGVALQMLFERTGEIGMVAEAVRAGRHAVEAMPAHHPDVAFHLSNLGRALTLSFEQTGKLEALAEAVLVNRQAVNAAPDDNGCLAGLGGALMRLFEHTGKTELLREGVQTARLAVRATAVDDPDSALYLSNLGLALQRMFEHTGRAEVLAEAVRVGRQAVQAIPEVHPGRAMVLNNLGLALRKQATPTEDLGLLTEAVSAARQAVDATPDGHPDLVKYLSNLTGTLVMLSERDGQINVLLEAVRVGREALQVTPDRYADRAGTLHDFGLTLLKLYDRTGETEHLTEAVQAARQAVDATPEGHPSRPLYLSSLSVMLPTLSAATGNAELLTEAVRSARLAVDTTADDHPGRAGFLHNLGTALLILSRGDPNAAELLESADCFRSASRIRTAGALTRIRSLNWFATAVSGAGTDRDEALAAIETAVALLPQVSPRTLARGDREHQAGRLESLAATAAATALNAGNPRRAVELLEATRGILVAETLDARSSDLAALAERSPTLARDFEDLRNRRELLDRPDIGFAAVDRQEAQAEWAALLGRIRAMDGFTEFLAAPDIEALTKQADAGQGPIVFVTAASARCDALILTGDRDQPVRTVRLAGFTVEEAVAQAETLRIAWHTASDPDRNSATARMDAQREILNVLAWLWDVVAAPVLKALNHTRTPVNDQAWPRIWWCPVGVMAYLPVHAAGHHRDLTGHAGAPDSPRSVIDLAVSSYTPTVRALAHARSHRPNSMTAGNTLIVAVHDAPGTPELRSVGQEADIVAELIPQALRPDHPVHDAVLDALPSHPVVHFACHGVTDWYGLASRLILCDHQTRPLTVADITALHLTGSLAYLSACYTTFASPRLADEALHLTGAFHLAGYQNVIGTLWPVDDIAALAIAADFYTALTAKGTTPPDTADSARALHHATRALRAEYPITPTYWAAHLHTGI